MMWGWTRGEAEVGLRMKTALCRAPWQAFIFRSTCFYPRRDTVGLQVKQTTSGQLSKGDLGR